MNQNFDYFNLYSTKNNQKKKLNPYLETECNTQRPFLSINNKKYNSHRNTINTNIYDEDGKYTIIKPYNYKKSKNNIFNYFKNNKTQKRNIIKMSSSSSNLNLKKIGNNMELKQRDLLIDRLHRELYKKNNQLYKQNSLITNLKNKIEVNRSEKININNNNLSINGKLSQFNNIYNLKKSPINKELISKLKENEIFYKKIINENLDSFNYKLIELENKNIILTKKNQSLKKQISDIKNKYSTNKSKKIFIKPKHEINLCIIKSKNVFKKDENTIKLKQLLSQYKVKNSKLSKEINLLKKDIQIKNNQIINVKNQFNSKQNKINEIISDNNIKEKEIESKKNEINDLNNKINQLLASFEKEKKEKEEIKNLYEKNNRLTEENKNKIEKIKSKSLEFRLNNISSSSHKVIFTKHISEYKLTWFLITDKNNNGIKNYINTFWVSEEEMPQIENKLKFDTDIDENINDIKTYKEEIKKLNNIIVEKDRIINQLKIKINENEIINNNSKNNIKEETDDKKCFVSMEKYIKLVNQLSESKIKIKNLLSEKKDNEINFLNSNEISEELYDFIKNNDIDNNNIKIFGQNKNNLNNSADTKEYLEKYIDDLESKIEKIKNLIKLLIKEMDYTSNLDNTLYNLMITSGFTDQESIFIIQEKQKSITK